MSKVATDMQGITEKVAQLSDFVSNVQNNNVVLRNILDSMEENQQSYFIGSIVLQEKDYSNYYIVDGQQRLSTLFLILLAYHLI